jgi:hypothetical protein
MISMRRGVSRFELLSLMFLLIITLHACSKSRLTSVDAPQGGKIVYGAVKGADTQAAALTSMLRSVHDDCGEKPQVGKVFKVLDTDSHAVFFTVVDHPNGNRKLAGMVIASQAGPGRVEAAMVSDDASRFGSTVNPMLQQLFGVWHPGQAAEDKAQESSSAPAVKLPAMHQVSLSDDTATVLLPDGWTLDPKFGGGGAMILGPKGEKLALNMWFLAMDPRGFNYRQHKKMGMPIDPHFIVCPYDIDLAKNFAEVFHKIRASNGKPHTDLKVFHAEMMPSKDSRCVNATGQMDRDGKGMHEFNIMLFASKPNQYGDYHFAIFDSMLAPNPTDQDRATAIAIVNSFKVNEELVNQRVTVTMAPILASMRRNYEIQQQQLLARSQQIVNGIKQIGANATARYNATQAANEAQHRSWEEGQDMSSRNTQGFSNYLLDQTVVQDNYRNTHSTEWNNTADALVKSNPDRYQIVDTPDYIKDKDF